jgi:hypothetical protein
MRQASWPGSRAPGKPHGAKDRGLLAGGSGQGRSGGQCGGGPRGRSRPRSGLRSTLTQGRPRATRALVAVGRAEAATRAAVGRVFSEYLIGIYHDDIGLPLPVAITSFHKRFPGPGEEVVPVTKTSRATSPGRCLVTSPVLFIAITAFLAGAAAGAFTMVVFGIRKVDRPWNLPPPCGTLLNAAARNLLRAGA